MMLILPNSEGGVTISSFIVLMYPFGVPRKQLYERNGN